MLESGSNPNPTLGAVNCHIAMVHSFLMLAACETADPGRGTMEHATFVMALS